MVFCRSEQMAEMSERARSVKTRQWGNDVKKRCLQRLRQNRSVLLEQARYGEPTEPNAGAVQLASAMTQIVQSELMCAVNGTEPEPLDVDQDFDAEPHGIGGKTACRQGGAFDSEFMDWQGPSGGATGGFEQQQEVEEEEEEEEAMTPEEEHAFLVQLERSIMDELRKEGTFTKSSCPHP
jgi:hypothetical protein